MDRQRIPIGISACVLGQNVRFNGGHKKSLFVTEKLSSFCSFVPDCPEISIGLPNVRPALRLVSDPLGVSLVEQNNPMRNHTQALSDFAHTRAEELKALELCGYVCCSKSPSCGMERVKICTGDSPGKNGEGLFVSTIKSSMPWLPIEEDGRLNDPVLRENFITRIFCLNDLYASMGKKHDARKLIAFHSRYKLTLLAYNPMAYRELGRMVAGINTVDINLFFDRYRAALMLALSIPASRRNHTNVLMHIQGYFKKVLTRVQKAELCKVIDEYRKGRLPLPAPLTLIDHYLSRYPNDYLIRQNYLNPHPRELALRYGI